ncbi:TadE/TadG family type IV pilus assembly protein [Brachybacterium kimchii]|uniref:Pilus assembly protein n=1 Tax=Brachybacterium kimchii TaxID=2942909 RepID=A0ABY4NBA3_9MICO|nr:TadE/TadG family type IV pilus assembly protein [Brachybacterium kimchii]UQN31829.1 pilus assembly protein [Brachybacterium kimchii]
MTRRDLERGAASTEVVILAPVFMLILGLLVVGAGIAQGQQSVTTAANSSARAASLAVNQQDATGRVQEAFTRELSQQGKTCTSVSVHVDASAFTSTPGEVSTVHSTIQCTITYGQLISVPGLAGTKTITVETASPLDSYRERS